MAIVRLLGFSIIQVAVSPFYGSVARYPVSAIDCYWGPALAVTPPVIEERFLRPFRIGVAATPTGLIAGLKDVAIVVFAKVMHSAAKVVLLPTVSSRPNSREKHYYKAVGYGKGL